MTANIPRMQSTLSENNFDSLCCVQNILTSPHFHKNIMDFFDFDFVLCYVYVQTSLQENSLHNNLFCLFNIRYVFKNNPPNALQNL
jgi:hypothetical protein